MAKSKKRQKSKKFKFHGLIYGIVLAAMATTGLAFYKQQYEIEHDLSVIGNGLPTVVQIHDPNCPLCRQLKKNTETALQKYGDTIQYRIADISTTKGKVFANRLKVKHVTLLLFDENGEPQQTITGVRESDGLRHIFGQLVKSK